jgi:hypothetical protein
MADLRIIEGGGEVIAFLERLLSMAREGRIDVVAVAVLESDGCTGTGLGYKADVKYAWTRTLGAIRVLEHDLLSGELVFKRKD